MKNMMQYVKSWDLNQENINFQILIPKMIHGKILLKY
nr:MAG TPA: hypothetical protein [Caudoviricetes sp.]